MNKFFVAALATAIAQVAFVSAAVAEARPEPFAGDVVNQSQYRVLIWGDNVAGPNTGVGYACVNAYTSTHYWNWANDVDFAYSASRGEWCKIGVGEARISSTNTWSCPEGWSRPSYLRYDLRC